VLTPAWARAALSHPCFTGLSRQHLGRLIAELADPWSAAHQAALQQRRGHGRRRAAGAGPKPRLVFCDRVLVTLVTLRLQLPHQALAVLYGVDRATITRAVHELRPLLAARGFAVPDQPAVRLRTLADVFAYAAANGAELRIDATETRVRRPRAHRVGRRVFVSGKRKQNTIKTTTVSDGAGRTLWSGAARPGRMHDQTAIKTEGIADLLGHHPTVEVTVDEGYRGWPRRSPIKSTPHPANRKRTQQPRRSPPGSRSASSSHPGGSAWSMPSPSTNTGGPCSAGSAAGRPMPRPTWRSLGWSPTEPRAAEHPTAGQTSTPTPQLRTHS
jgi:DDE superfamily endonuclease/Helix-turn-helix of DDE superfamily endonuclease